MQKVRTRAGAGRKATPPLPMPMPDALLGATTRADVVTVPARTTVSCDGQGAPESEVFQRAVGALYGVAFTLKLARKRAGAREFKLGPLEGRWWALAQGPDFALAPRTSWRWRLRLAVPDDTTEAEVAAAVHIATTRRGGKLEKSAEAARVVLERIGVQRAGRALHLGPYSEEGRTFREIGAALAAAGITPASSHLEIYLSDPRRTPPARLKTVLLLETH